LKKQVLLFEASKIFDENVRYESASPFGYVGKATILRTKLDNEHTKEGKAAVLTEAVAMLEEASDLTSESPIITGELAWFRRKLGDLGDVAALVREGVKRSPADVRLRRMLVQFERDFGNLKEAAATGIAGIQYAPTSWLLYRDVARLKRQLNEQTHIVKNFYESAIRHNQGDIALMIELGAFLFTRGNYTEYQKVFRDVDLLQVAGHEKTRIRERMRAGSSLKSYSGKVKVIRGANGYITSDVDNVDIFFWRSDAGSTFLREGQRVSFHLGFNSKGAIAFDVASVQD
jgi:cold shock CspA family protein